MYIIYVYTYYIPGTNHFECMDYAADDKLHVHIIICIKCNIS